MIAFHGTSKSKAESIKRFGFRIGTYFAYRKEDAIRFGGPYLFRVEIPRHWKSKGVPDGWQFWIRDEMPPSSIISTEEVVMRKTCHICGLPVSRNKAVPDEIFRSRDHLKPRSAGGESTPGNILVSHRYCNAVRSSDPITEELRTKLKTLMIKKFPNYFAVAVLLAAALQAQTSAPQPQFATIRVTIAYPKPALLRAKYSIRSVPKGYVVAEITARNQSRNQIDITESDVVQEFKAHGLEVWRSTDGAAILSNAQGSTGKARFYKWSVVAFIVTGETILSGVIKMSPAQQNRVSVGISLGAAIANNIATASGAIPNATYQTDGMQTSAQIPARQGMIVTVLMTTPPAGAPDSFDVQVPLTVVQTVAQ